MSKISVIVPVFNTAMYLEKCFDSIINQTHEDMELIIINDASTDNSEKIIKKYVKKYKNKIKYINKKQNEYQGTARNEGIAIASGEYLMFIDSDDWIEKDMAQSMYEVAIKNNSDIVICDMLVIENDNKSILSFEFDDEDHQKSFIKNCTSACNLLIKKEIFNDVRLRFPEKIIYEDLALLPILGVITSKINHINKSLYMYEKRSDSTMHVADTSRLLNIFDALNYLTELFNIYDVSEEYNEELEYIYIRRLLSSAALRFIDNNVDKKYIDQIRYIIKSNYPNWKKNKYYQQLGFKQKLVGKLVYNEQLIILKIIRKLSS